MDSTLKDVAHASGVSIRTAKRALSGARYIDSATRERVLAVAARLTYEPNLAARALKIGRSFEIGVMLASIDELCRNIGMPDCPAMPMGNEPLSFG